MDQIVKCFKMVWDMPKSADIFMNTVMLNIPKLIPACERHYHWEHVILVYTRYDEFDQAAITMMAHSPTAFAHDQF